MTRIKVGVTLLATGVLALLALGTPALAKDGDVLVNGTCSARSSMKLKLSTENGRIEVEAEVDQNRSGVPWTVTLTRGGVRVARAVRVTRPPSGSFAFRKLVSNGAGTDVVRVVATRRGETCAARAIWTA